MARNPLLQWYYKFMRPKINSLVIREEDERKSIDEMPMTKFLFAYIRKI